MLAACAVSGKRCLPRLLSCRHRSSVSPPLPRAMALVRCHCHCLLPCARGTGASLPEPRLRAGANGSAGRHSAAGGILPLPSLSQSLSLSVSGDFSLGAAGGGGTGANPSALLRGTAACTRALPPASASDAAPAVTDSPAAATALQEEQKRQKGQQEGALKGRKGGAKAEGKGKGGGDVASKIAPRSENFSRWYLDVIREAQLADYGPVRGTMVIRPYGYAIWEAIQSWLDRRFKETGHQNMYFPQFIPYSFIEKEASHVEGFSPELALVTIGGGKELEERLVVRPTSETIVNHMFAQWIQSYRDLPMLINQWANVTRWEMSTRPFVRTLEFLWQEGHTAHATEAEAEEEAMRMVQVYREFAWEQAALPVVVGRKSRNETFAGADRTYTIEAMMGDCRALQAGTSHLLGQNFAKAFGTQYLAETGEREYVWQTSWGVSTRMVGAVIMGHGDDRGLQLPPRLAPLQVVVVPIWKKAEERGAVLAAALEVEGSLKAAGVRCTVDSSEQQTPGWKFNHWEMKGVPVRIEIGPKDVASRTVVTARRDRPGKEGKQMGVPMEAEVLRPHVLGLLEEVQDALLATALAFRDSNIVDVTSYEELKATVAQGKWARGFWQGSDEDEKRIKEETGATLRCFPLEQPSPADGAHTCFFTSEPAQEVAIFARAY